ncbi:MAG TPA: ATP synthase F0 subunit C [Chthonomonadaceae bacterium]|nr:ATP synthase F0 subunit C [Chthonomonadaceae bacterium]
MVYFMALALALGFGVPVAVLSAALGQGKAAAAALEGMARQPEQTGRLQTAMILALAFIESLVIFTLLVFFLMQGNLPKTSDVLSAIQAGAGAAATAPATR